MTHAFPTPLSVGHKVATKSTDLLGNTTIIYGSPSSLPAYSISPHTVEVGSTTLTETEVADLDVYMPKAAINLKDRFSIDNVDYEVVGVQDWTMGFHGWQPGIVVELKKVS